ncbi:MAG: hypothetical protein ACOYL9_08950 [Ilumatobacteraceae bacterium]
MLAVDFLSGLLGAALAFLILSVGLIVASQPSPTRRPEAPRSLPARATVRAIPTRGTQLVPGGQIAPSMDSPLPKERTSLDVATELARHYADNDPQRIVEVISFWMHEEVAERLEQAARMPLEFVDPLEPSPRQRPERSPRHD